MPGPARALLRFGLATHSQQKLKDESNNINKEYSH